MKAQLKTVSLSKVWINGRSFHLVEIEGYPGYYISTLGTVVSTVSGYMGRGPNPRGSSKHRILKAPVNNQGYKRVSLTAPGKKPRYELVHRLVAEAFLCPPDPAPDTKQPFLKNLRTRSQVNHIDGNKRNNRASNLEWNSPQENSDHRKFLKKIRNEGVFLRKRVSEKQKKSSSAKKGLRND
jgi:hypothetical protein